MGARPAGLVPATALSGPGKGRTMRKGALTEEDRAQKRAERIAYKAVLTALSIERATCYYCGRVLNEITGRPACICGVWRAVCKYLDCQEAE